LFFSLRKSAEKTLSERSHRLLTAGFAVHALEAMKLLIQFFFRSEPAGHKGLRYGPPPASCTYREDYYTSQQKSSKIGHDCFRSPGRLAGPFTRHPEESPRRSAGRRRICFFPTGGWKRTKQSIMSLRRHPKQASAELRA
jgi:hypothetical protein